MVGHIGRRFSIVIAAVAQPADVMGLGYQPRPLDGSQHFLFGSVGYNAGERARRVGRSW
jgi:hypothetical protein